VSAAVSLGLCGGCGAGGHEFGDGDAGARALVELGPGNVLTGMAKRTVPGATTIAVSTPDDLDRLLTADALTLVTKAAAGELESLRVVTDVTPDGRLHHFVVGAWRPALPADAAVILLDATGNADDIAAVVGRPVVDCTPSGHLPLQRPVVQIPDDMSEQLIKYYLDHAQNELSFKVSKDEFTQIYELQSIQRCFKACGSFSSFFHLRSDRRYLKYIHGTLKRVKASLDQFPEYKFFETVLKDSGAFTKPYETL
jgi:hypothetical protein